MNKVCVNASKSYDILIDSGLLPGCGETIKAHMRTDKAFIVTDDKVAPLYLSVLENALNAAGIQTDSFVFPNGEQSKTAPTYIQLLNTLAEKKIHRGDTLIALGGGVVGDLTGFAAATYLRGIPFIQIPTTLLACVDSSVGGKTAIDLDAGKNLAGAFYQPELVLCDTDTLKTLDEENYKCGMAEVVKYAILCDRDFYNKLMDGSLSIAQIITRCVEIKSDVVAQDEFDNGTRKLLNFGHTLGHAIEACSSYTVPHGLAVAAGMMAITQIAYNNGICDLTAVEETERILDKYNLPKVFDYTLEQLAEKITSDKKVEGKKIDLIVPKSVGNCVLYPLPLTELNAFVQKGKNA